MGREEESDTVAAMVPRLIEKATNSTAPEINPRLLKAIKYTVRYSDDEVHAAVQSLMVQMKKPHSQVLLIRIPSFESILYLSVSCFLCLHNFHPVPLLLDIWAKYGFVRVLCYRGIPRGFLWNSSLISKFFKLIEEFGKSHKTCRSSLFEELSCCLRNLTL